MRGRNQTHTAPAVVFRSRYHPGDAPRSLVVAESLIAPLASVGIPFMVVVLASVLLGHPALPYLWALPVLLLVASAWSAYTLRRRLAEVRVWQDRAAVRTVWHVVSRAPVRYEPIFDLRRLDHSALLTVGLDQVDLERAAWPAFEDLLASLRTAKHHAAS